MIGINGLTSTEVIGVNGQTSTEVIGVNGLTSRVVIGIGPLLVVGGEFSDRLVADTSSKFCDRLNSIKYFQ